jgi:hypothetical protein
MKKEVLIAGLLGGVVMLIWLTISNAMIPIKSSLIHKTIPFQNQVELHQALKTNITEPGTYSVPYVGWDEESKFPDYRNQPVYSITYSGYTHGSAGSIADFLPIPIMFAVPMFAAWMLSVSSRKIRQKYIRRVMFVVTIGLIVALSDDILQMSFGPQPRDYLVFLAVNNVITWVLTGLAIAWKIKPVNE